MNRKLYKGMEIQTIRDKKILPKSYSTRSKMMIYDTTKASLGYLYTKMIEAKFPCETS